MTFLQHRAGSNVVANHGAMTFTRKDNGLNQYRAWWPYSWINYDDDIGGSWGSPVQANGVIMQDGWITAGFNALNQPMYIWSANVGWTYFGYDPLGRCVKRWNDAGSTAYLYYDGWNLIQEGSQSWNAERQYIHGARVDEVVAQITPPNNWIRYFHYDASGNCTLQTDAFGNIVEQYEYDAFGHPYFFDGGGTEIGYSPWGNRFLFTGREYLSDLKLYDFRNRMYQPELGRFLQPDPKEFGAGDYNLYRYCHNDPVNKNDPFGLIDSGLLEKLKEHLRKIETDQRKDHNDRTLGTKKDLTPGKETIGTIKTNHTMGRFERNKMKTEVLPESNKELAGTSHYHSAPYYKVNGNDTSLPSRGADITGVKLNGIPMLFGSDPLKATGQAILIEARKGQEPSKESISIQYDK